MKMKELKKIYPYNNEDKRFVINVQLEDYRDAYSDWDFSPFTNRDLDDDFIEFLIESSFEIPLKYQLIVNVHILNQKFNAQREQKGMQGMKNYFGYQIRKLNNQKIRVIRDIVAFLVIGSILLLTGVSIGNYADYSIALAVLTEGIQIGGWVMLWEMFSAWIFDMKKVNDKTKHFKRLLDSIILYSYGEES